MPIYGQEKVHHMVRSILPSKARKNAKYAKDKLHRENRRHSTLQLAKYRGYAEDIIEDFYDDDANLEYWVEPHQSNGWGNIVWDRRNADKLAHFENWAYERTKHLRPEDRLSNIAALLPDGVIGEHAVSHLSFLEPPNQRRRFWWRTDDDMTPYRRRKRYNHSYYLEKRELRNLVWAHIFEVHHDDRQRERLNNFMIANCKNETISKWDAVNRRWNHEVIYHPVVIMKGYHDIYKFFRAIEKDRYYWDLVCKYFDIE